MFSIRILSSRSPSYYVIFWAALLLLTFLLGLKITTSLSFEAGYAAAESSAARADHPITRNPVNTMNHTVHARRVIAAPTPSHTAGCAHGGSPPQSLPLFFHCSFLVVSSMAFGSPIVDELVNRIRPRCPDDCAVSVIGQSRIWSWAGVTAPRQMRSNCSLVAQGGRTYIKLILPG